MTNSQRPSNRASDDGDPAGRKRKRKKKDSAAADDDASAQRKSPEERRRRRTQRKAPALAAGERAPATAPDAPPQPYAGFAQPRVLALLAATVVAGVIYERNLIGDGNRPYALIALSLLSFMVGSAPGTNPRITVGAGGLLVCIGLAIEGTQPSDLGVTLCMFGGLLLTGGIHRLGRDGVLQTA